MSLMDIVGSFTPLGGVSTAIKAIAGVILVIIVIIAANSIYEGLNMDRWLGFVGIESKSSLKKKVDDQTKQKELAIEANQSNAKVDAAASSIKDAALVGVGRMDDNKAKNDQKASTIVSKKNDALDHASVHKHNIDASGISEKDFDMTSGVERSQIRINAIWQAYCSHNNDPACAAVH